MARSHSRHRMIGFMLYRYFISSWIRRQTRSQATLGVVLPLLGVAIGVASFTVVLSIMGGFVHNLKNKLLGVEPHAEVIRSEDFGYLDPDIRLLEQLRSVPGVAALSPFQKGDAILQSDSRPVTAIVTGLDPENPEAFSRFNSFLMEQGDVSLLGQKRPVDPGEPGVEPHPPANAPTFPSVILGSGVARALGVSVGSRVTFVSTIPEDGPFGMAPRQFPAVVYDVLHTGSTRYDAKVVLTTLSFANSFFDLNEEWAGLQVLVDRRDAIDEISAEMNESLASAGFAARVKPWTESNGALLRALKLERWGMSFVLYMVILVGCFTITITLVLSVKRKAREMAILRSVGFERVELGVVYLLQGLMIGTVGVVLGLSLGLGVLHLLSRPDLPLVTAAYNGRPFPVLIHWPDIIAAAVGSVFLSGLASLWPAWEVMRIDVVETLSDRG